MTGPASGSGVEPALPGALADLDALFDSYRSFGSVVLAVSGGSDSVALLHLSALWAKRHRGPTLVVATVDHGLRPGSADEAAAVARMAAALGLSHHTLTWDADKPRQGVQAQARAARYRLLGDLAGRLGPGPVAVATAHTADDQAETVLMRLARGSGPDGLRGMAPQRPLDGLSGVMLLRPLLPQSRAVLRGWLEAQAVAWIEDPSNDDDRFERVRLRQALPVLNGLGLTAAMVSLAAGRQARAVAALEAATQALQEQALDLHGGAFASLDGALLTAAPEEIRVRLLGRIIGAMGGTSAPTELPQVERLAAAIGQPGGVRTTLGGCCVRACGRQVRVFREAGRMDLDLVRLQPGTSLTFDARFRITLSATSAGPVDVRTLAPDVYRMLRRSQPKAWRLPARAATTLPSVWRDGVLLAVGGVEPATGPVGRVTQEVMIDSLIGARLAK